jgi:hypothetical protein
MRLPGFRVRTLVIAVAVAGVARVLDLIYQTIQAEMIL